MMMSPARLRSLCLCVVFLVACEPEEPSPSPTPSELKVSFTGPATVYCHTHPVVLTFTVEGGTPDSVELNGEQGRIAPLAAPYQYLFDCGAEVEERTYAFTATARVGERAFSSPRKQVVVDRTAPTIEAPPFRSADLEISKDAPIRVTFSEPMRTDKVTPSSVDLTGAYHLEGLSWSEDGRILTVLPSGGISAPQTLTLSLHPEDFQDLAGNALSPRATTQWSWTVPAFLSSWLLPKHGNGVDASEHPAFAVDRSGRYVVAWPEFTSVTGSKDVYVYRSGADGGAPLGAALNALPGNNTWAEQVTLAVDASDRPVVAWIEQAPEDNRIFVRRWNGSSWEELGSLPNPTPGKEPFQLTLAIGNSDLPAVAWSQLDASGEANVYVYRWNGSAWAAVGSPVEARGDKTHAGHPALAIDSEDRPVIAFREEGSEGGVADVFVMRWNGTSWVQIGSSLRPPGVSASAYAHQLTLVLDAKGRPTVAFQLITPGSSYTYTLFYSRHGDTGWSTPTRVGGTRASRPMVSIDAQDQLWLAWQEQATTSTHRVELLKVDEVDPRASSLLNAANPVLASGGGAEPVVLVVDEARKVPRVVRRQ